MAIFKPTALTGNAKTSPAGGPAPKRVQVANHAMHQHQRLQGSGAIGPITRKFK
jgi:hypothetical protein